MNDAIADVDDVIRKNSEKIDSLLGETKDSEIVFEVDDFDFAGFLRNRSRLFEHLELGSVR